ncbi:MAG TPA: polyphosphate kinase 2 family protein [Chthoniobacteraceae bacterium]|nr:polyphosphate kinase 2 family protein [Chthoniobacteraceae bacterium]
MKAAGLVARSGSKPIRLRKIDPGATGGATKEAAARRLEKIRAELCELQQILYAEHRRSLLIIFQAMDTGGKDGAIKSLCAGINPSGIVVTNFKAPTATELDHDFLWRAHRAVPGAGMIGIWNRSHYEDVLVVRVHKLVPAAVWQKRFDQINSFEALLAANGVTLVKFMLHISRDEQKERLQARLDDPEKWWKFNPRDLEDRARWKDYENAYEEVLNRCGTERAPWHVVPADRKWSRNLVVGETVLGVLKKMAPRYPKPAFDPKAIRIE